VKKVSILSLTALVVALAVPTLASNTGFKLNHPLVPGGRNFVSVPYFYFPSGTITDPAQTACDLCNDFETGDCDIVNVVRLNKVGTVLSPVSHSCCSILADFPMVPGEGYFVNATAACTADIVGSHDDDYSVGGTKNVTVTPGNNPVSVPYHVQANDSDELCDHIAEDNGVAAGSWDIQNIVRINPATGAPVTYTCGAILGIFPITPGEAYFFVPDPGTTVTIEWRTY
jgi:hypothetical protein